MYMMQQKEVYMSKISDFFVSCPRDLEGFLKEEISAHNLEIRRESRGGFLLHTEEEKIFPFLFSSSIASRIFKKVLTVPAVNQKSLCAEIGKFEWHKIIAPHDTFKINCVLDKAAKERFSNSLYLSQLMKDAIVDQIREETDDRPDIDTKDPSHPLLIRIEYSPKQNKMFAHIYLDICGRALSHRGYRRGKRHQAPLRENLAAAIVKASEWNKDQGGFFDPMCGSGTILIEAIINHLGLPANYLQIIDIVENQTVPYAFFFQKDWFVYESELWDYLEKTYAEIQTKIGSLDKNLFYANDKNFHNTNLLREHLLHALIPKDAVQIKCDDATLIQPPQGKGVIVTNPPYGERLSDQEEVEQLFYDFGENLKKNFKGWIAHIFCPHGNLKKKISLRTSKKTPFWNGSIECRLLKYDLF